MREGHLSEDRLGGTDADDITWVIAAGERTNSCVTVVATVLCCLGYFAVAEADTGCGVVDIYGGPD